MIFDIKEYAGKIDPAKIIWLLQYRGWNEIPLKVNYKRVFQTEEECKFYQADVPLFTDLSDFNTAMLMATETLAETMHMSADQIIWTLLA